MSVAGPAPSGEIRWLADWPFDGPVDPLDGPGAPFDGPVDPLDGPAAAGEGGAARRGVGRRWLVPGAAALGLVALLAGPAVGRLTSGGPPRRELPDGTTELLERSLRRAPRVSWEVDLGEDVRVIRARQRGGAVLVAYAPRFEIGPVTLVALGAADGRRQWSTDLRLVAGDRWVVTADTIVVGGDDDRGRAAASGFDLATGARRWTREVAGEGAAQPLFDASRPDVVLISAAGRLEAVEPATGRLRWGVDGPRILAGPVLAGDVVVSATDGALEGRDRASGERRWRRAVGDTSPLALAASDRLVVASTGRQWLALEAGDGRVRWAVADDHRLTFAAELGAGRLAVGDGRRGRVVDAGSGLTQRELGVAPAAVVREGDERRLLAAAGEVTVAVDPSSGVTLGTASSDARAVRSLSADALYAVRDGNLSAYDLAGLRPRWSLRLAAPVASSPAVICGGRPLVVHDGGGRLLAYG